MVISQTEQYQNDMAVNFGVEIRLERVRRDLSQLELAEASELSRNTIRKIEKITNVNDVPNPWLVLIAHGFGWTIQEFDDWFARTASKPRGQILLRFAARKPMESPGLKRK